MLVLLGGFACLWPTRASSADEGTFKIRLVARKSRRLTGWTNGFEPGVLQGPIIDQVAVDKVEEHIQDAVSQGARILLGGNRHALGQNFFEPTVLVDVTPQMSLVLPATSALARREFATLVSNALDPRTAKIEANILDNVCRHN
jgi:hypothetical protein